MAPDDTIRLGVGAVVDDDPSGAHRGAGDLTPTLVDTDIWTDSMLADAGIPVVDSPMVSVGGGMGSFVFTDYLRIAGVPASSIRVLTVLDQPWQTYQYLTRVSQVPAGERLRSDAASCPGNIWGFPSYGAREAWREKTLAPLFERGHRADPHRLLDPEGGAGLRGHPPRGRPDLLVGLHRQGAGADGPPAGGRRLLQPPHAARRDEPHQAGRVSQHLRAPRSRLPGSQVPPRPPGVPAAAPRLGTDRERVRAARAGVPAAPQPARGGADPRQRHRRVAAAAAAHRRP